MTPTADRCRGCPASAGGCAARERADAGRCCPQCSHTPVADDGLTITLLRLAAPRSTAAGEPTDPNKPDNHEGNAS